MATLSYPSNSNIQPNRLVRELPARLREVRQIHDVNYALIISSIIITLVVMALAWLVAANSTQPMKVNAMSDIARTVPYSQPLSIGSRLGDVASR